MADIEDTRPCIVLRKLKNVAESRILSIIRYLDKDTGATVEKIHYPVNVPGKPTQVWIEIEKE